MKQERFVRPGSASCRLDDGKPARGRARTRADSSWRRGEEPIGDGSSEPEEKLSRKRVEQRAAAHRATNAARSGRKPTPPELRCVRLFDKLLSSGALVQTGAVASLNGEAAARASEVVREVRKWCDAVEAVLLPASKA